MLGSNEGASRGMLERRALRQEHERLYLRQRVLHWRMALMLCGRLGTQRRALQKLESRLSDEEAAQFRWWAWAKRRRAGAPKVHSPTIASVGVEDDGQHGQLSSCANRQCFVGGWSMQESSAACWHSRQAANAAHRLQLLQFHGWQTRLA